jgi:uncharacterized membrane protein
VNLIGRRRVLWDYLAGALWVLPTLSVVGFLVAAEDARSLLADVYRHRPRHREPEERCPEPPLEAVGVPSGRSGYVQAIHAQPADVEAVAAEAAAALRPLGADPSVAPAERPA